MSSALYTTLIGAVLPWVPLLAQKLQHYIDEGMRTGVRW